MMRSFNLVPVAILALVMSACTTRTASEDINQGSSLTSIDINLPSKDKLPKGLQGENLRYCFSVAEGSTPVYDSTPQCIVPYSSKDMVKKGEYVGAIKLDTKLDSSKNYTLSLVIGYTGNSKEDQNPIVMTLAPKLSSTISGSDLNPGTEQDSDINFSKLYYFGVKHVTSYDMKGLSRLQVAIELNKYGALSQEGSDEQNPDTISTGKELDIEIVPVFNESNDHIVGGG